FEQGRGRIVEHREIARVIDDVSGVAVTPLDLDVAPVHEHMPRLISAPCAASHRGGPLRRSGTNSRPYEAPVPRTRRRGRAGAGTESLRRASPGLPAADWRAAA